MRLGAAVSAIEEVDERPLVRCGEGHALAADAVILTVPLPLLNRIVLPASERERAAAAHIGFGNVIKILFRFGTAWWSDRRRDSGASK
jgi:monoamine oxidase